MVKNESQGKARGWFPGGTRCTLQNQLSIFVGNGNMVSTRSRALFVGRPRDHDPHADYRFISGGAIFTIQKRYSLLSVEREDKERQRRKAQASKTTVPTSIHGKRYMTHE